MPKAIDDSGMENSVTATLRLMLPSQKTAEGLLPRDIVRPASAFPTGTSKRLPSPAYCQSFF